MRYIPYVIRIILDIVLAVVVWRNSHWSVALSITLIFVSIELVTVNIHMNNAKIARRLQRDSPSKLAAAMFAEKIKESNDRP